MPVSSFWALIFARQGPRDGQRVITFTTGSSSDVRIALPYESERKDDTIERADLTMVSLDGSRKFVNCSVACERERR